MIMSRSSKSKPIILRTSALQDMLVNVVILLCVCIYYLTHVHITLPHISLPHCFLYTYCLAHALAIYLWRYTLHCIMHAFVVVLIDLLHFLQYSLIFCAIFSSSNKPVNYRIVFCMIIEVKIFILFAKILNYCTPKIHWVSNSLYLFKKKRLQLVPLICTQCLIKGLLTKTVLPSIYLFLPALTSFSTGSFSKRFEMKIMDIEEITMT